ncbi:hypothetical protein SAMN04488515_1683 [Cognatiyoonia koreensis]|uniref:DUF2065 domain-containing protein n=1 Tax=Cognatiyoonia koreensis TaxID=364200 RepID=A0A1I0Q5D1_9RHOB|nr:hypothetical protein SAMN04488515_1683 [Cognatiyoonia koreensis]
MIIGYIILALGLVLIVEGLVYALAPSLVEDLLAALRNLSLEQRRIVGVVALASGVALVWIAATVLPGI